MPLHIRTRPNVPLFARGKLEKLPRELKNGRNQVYFPESLRWAAYQIADHWGISRVMYLSYLIIEGICRDAGLKLPEGFAPVVETDEIFSKEQAEKLRDKLASAALAPAAAPATPTAPTPAPALLAPTAEVCEHGKVRKFGCPHCARAVWVAKHPNKNPKKTAAPAPVPELPIDPLSVL